MAARRAAAGAPPVRSALLRDVLAGLGLPGMAASLAPPVRSATEPLFRPPPPPSRRVRAEQRAALVVVSCSSDYANDGFAARVAETRRLGLEPLLAAFRAAGSADVIHVPNGRVPDGACKPLPGEYVANSTAGFDARLATRSITVLFYVGFAANTDMLFGVGGMQRYYSNARYLRLPTPRYYWVDGRTAAIEDAETIEGRDGEGRARVPATAAHRGDARLGQADALRGGAADRPLYELRGTRHIRAGDVVTYRDIDGSYGPALVDRSGNASVTIGMSLSTTSTDLRERPSASWKAVGTPWAVRQAVSRRGLGHARVPNGQRVGVGHARGAGVFCERQCDAPPHSCARGAKRAHLQGRRVAAAEMNPLDFRRRCAADRVPELPEEGRARLAMSIRSGAHPPPWHGCRRPSSQRSPMFTPHAEAASGLRAGN